MRSTKLDPSNESTLWGDTMSTGKINPLIMDKLEKRDIAPHIKGFLREVLQYEKGKRDQAYPHFTSEYENLLNKYVAKAKRP